MPTYCFNRAFQYIPIRYLSKRPMTMKAIFVQCRIQPWWATEVLKDIVDHTNFSQASIYTLISSGKWLTTKKHKLKIHTIFPSRLNWLFASNQQVRRKKIFDHRYLITIAPLCMRYMSKRIQKLHPNKIIISSFAIAKNIDNYGIPTTLYLHSPMQYIRTHADEYRAKLKGIQSLLRSHISPYLQKRDQKYTTFNKVYVNSLYTAQTAKDIYNLESTVTYPHIDNIFYSQQISTTPQSYYVYIGRLVRFVKELDRIIIANNTLWFPLIIIGSGPDEQYLKDLAEDNTIFIPRTSTEQYIKILKEAKGLINITKESFGIVTAQAIALGVPVLGYNWWATPELINTSNGLLINSKDKQTLINQRRKFDQHTFDRKAIHEQAKQNKNSTFVEF